MNFQGLSIDSVNIHTGGSGVRLISKSYSRYSGWAAGAIKGDLGKPNRAVISLGTEV